MPNTGRLSDTQLFRIRGAQYPVGQYIDVLKENKPSNINGCKTREVPGQHLHRTFLEVRSNMKAYI